MPLNRLVLASEDELRPTLPRRTPELACARYAAARAGIVHSYAHLEGNPLTPAQVGALLAGAREEPPAADPHDVSQALDLAEASAVLEERVLTGGFGLDVAQAEELNGILARHEALLPGVRRSASAANTDGAGATVSVQGDLFLGLSKQELAASEPLLFSRIAQLRRPVVRALNLAAAGAYLQMFWDGNKRTSRFLADGELLAHGFDSIVVPPERKQDYHDAVAALFRSHDVGPYARFLLEVARRAAGS